MTLTVSSLLGINIFTIHHKLVVISGQDMWISVLLGGALAYIMSMLYYLLAKQYPKQDLPMILQELLGKIAGRIITVLFIVLVVTYAGLGLRIFTQVVRVFLLDRTPTYAIVLLMSAVVIFAVDKGIFTISNVCDILFPVFMISLTIFMLLSLKSADLIRIEPILHKNTSGLIKSIFPAYRSFTGFGIIAYIMCYMNTAKKTFKWFTVGMVISVFIISAAVFVTLLNFGPDEIKTMVYPFLALSKTVELPNTLIERLEGFIAIVWVPISFITVTIFTFISVRNVICLFNIKPRFEKIAVYAHLPLISFIALYSSNSLQSLEYFEYVQTYGALLGWVSIPALLLIAAIKKRGKSNV